jgi:CBS domain containing-hemolysin-like protein
VNPPRPGTQVKVRSLGQSSPPVHQSRLESDTPATAVELADTVTVRLPASMAISAFNEALGADLPLAPESTVAEALLQALGRPPRPGEQVRVGACVFTIDKMDGARTHTVRFQWRPA